MTHKDEKREKRLALVESCHDRLFDKRATESERRVAFSEWLRAANEYERSMGWRP